MTAKPEEFSVYDYFVEARSLKTQVSAQEVENTVSAEVFFDQLLKLHKEWRAADCSFGYMAEQLGISYFALNDILNRLGLPVYQG